MIKEVHMDRTVRCFSTDVLVQLREKVLLSLSRLLQDMSFYADVPARFEATGFVKSRWHNAPVLMEASLHVPGRNSAHCTGCRFGQGPECKTGLPHPRMCRRCCHL